MSTTVDGRLFEASRTGNVDHLLQLIRDDPLALEALALSSGETPLHIAAMAGHLDFVKMMIGLKPEFAKEVNQDGLSPLHMASANGHLEIVRELLKLGSELCRIKGKDRRVSLHHAAMKGRVDVIAELLSACTESLGDVSVLGETALHLSVKNHQFEAFKVLVEGIKHLNKDYLLNRKDKHGNTVLHLATYSKQLEVIELLFSTFDSGTVEVNATNETGLTALDLLVSFSSEAGDREILEILQSAGAKRARDGTSPHSPMNNIDEQVIIDRPTTSQTTQRTQCPMDRLVEFFKFQRGRDPPSDARSALLVIAILIATATYQAVLSPPGGLWQDSTAPDGNYTMKAHTAGKSILGSVDLISFGLFVFSNSAGFFLSLFMINILTSGFPLQLELQISLIAMMLTYDTAMGAIIPNGRTKTLFIIISSVLPTAIPCVAKLVRVLIHRSKCRMTQWRIFQRH